MRSPWAENEKVEKQESRKNGKVENSNMKGMGKPESTPEDRPKDTPKDTPEDKLEYKPEHKSEHEPEDIRKMIP